MLICLKDFFSIRDSAHTCRLDYWLRTALYSLSCACRNPPRCYAIWALRHTLSRALYRPVYHLCRSSSFYIELLKSREHLPFFLDSIRQHLSSAIPAILWHIQGQVKPQTFKTSILRITNSPQWLPKPVTSPQLFFATIQASELLISTYYRSWIYKVQISINQHGYSLKASSTLCPLTPFFHLLSKWEFWKDTFYRNNRQEQKPSRTFP